MLVCLFVFLYPINVKTVKPIGSKFCVVPYMTSGKVHRCSELQKFVFVKFLKSTKIVNSQHFHFWFIEEKILKDWATIKCWNKKSTKRTDSLEMINQLYYDDFCKRCPIKHGNMVLFDGIFISFLLLRARSLYSSHVVHVLCGAIFWPLDVSCWILILQGVPKNMGIQWQIRYRLCYELAL